jgi:hypothetical protein
MIMFCTLWQDYNLEHRSAKHLVIKGWNTVCQYKAQLPWPLRMYYYLIQVVYISYDLLYVNVISMTDMIVSFVVSKLVYLDCVVIKIHILLIRRNKMNVFGCFAYP